MEPRKKRSPTEIVDSIHEKATDLREAATALTQRIELFEQYLSKLNGRTEGVASGSHPDASGEFDLRLVLRFHKEEKDWLISWDSAVPDEAEDAKANWRPLREAPVKIKIAAIDLFPDLLLAIEKVQRRTVRQIAVATTTFDEFFEPLKLRGGK